MTKTGDSYFDSEDFREILSEYEESQAQGMPVFLDSEELSEIADYYQMLGQEEQADEAINLALSLSPGDVAPLSFKIRQALYDGDVESAKKYFKQITEKDEPEYTYIKVEILISDDCIDEADACLRKLLRKMPKEECQDFILDAASIFSDYGVNDKALEWMRRAEQEDTPDFKEIMARTLFGLGKYGDSAKLFNELIDTDPFSTRYWNGLASAQFMNEDYSEAVQSSEFAIAISPDDPESILAKANGLYRLGNYEEALNYFKKYDELVDDDEFSLMNQGSCYVFLGQNDKARAMLEKAAEVAPKDSPYLCDIYQELAFSLSDDGETDEAINYLNRTDELDCDHAQLLVIKGHIMLAADRWEEAEEYFKQALEMSDNSLQVVMRIIVSLYDNRHLEACYKMFIEFFKQVPKDYTEGFAYMALCCYDLKKYDEFLYYLRIACKRNPKECRLVLSHLFPKDLEPEKYYEYIKKKLK